MIRIGITGGIGSGKSVVSEIFHLHGIPLYNADLEAKKLNDSSPYIREQLTLQIGKDLYIDDKLDRKKLASIIFHDSRKLAIVNSIIHPELARHFTAWCLQRRHYPMVILDAALLIEAGFHQFVDKVIMVQAPKELRIERVIQRDGSVRNEVEARMDSQLPEEEKIKYADYVICNDNRHSLIRQVSDLMKEVTKN
ncbi:dephospho-CoA kinase [Proteiniphilum saccharofermentans]|jgi:dephospho-CoA kinase|uniref:Dephospho-CoA kinase n=1 Tax=Proteiniphilum saccharofermentans TaxID=1642647 RepID=A0A1R3T7L5_9BACT|nr:dephospho-CoA kinase [Proteiniphilum saccharofermentans]SCD22079.1 dephospho-CoA kinase [Proteiniphilum saccharofermentans]